MQKLLTLLLLSVIFISCGKTKTHTEDIQGTALPNDTIVYKYKLGDSFENVNKHTESLISHQVLKPFTELTIRRAGTQEDFKIEGYACTLFVGSDSIPSIMSLVFHNDSLLRQEFFMYNRFPYKELINLYGSPKIVKGYPLESNKDLTTFWSIGDKAIYVADDAKSYTLYIEKISAKLRLLNK